MGKRASVGGEGAKKRLTQASANRLVTDVSFIIERRQHEQQEAEIKKICEQLRENPRLIPGVITLIECGGAGYEDNFPRGIGTQGTRDPVVLLVPAAGWALRGRQTPDIGRRKRSFPKPETAN